LTIFASSYCDKIGALPEDIQSIDIFPFTRSLNVCSGTENNVAALQTDMLRDPNKPLTLNWFRRFIKRWPELCVCTPRSLEVSRAKSTSAQVISSYFDGLQKVIKKYNLEDKSHPIFNVDV
jgi:hypothetical protein